MLKKQQFNNGKSVILSKMFYRTDEHGMNSSVQLCLRMRRDYHANGEGVAYELKQDDIVLTSDFLMLSENDPLDIMYHCISLFELYCKERKGAWDKEEGNLSSMSPTTCYTGG